MGHTWIFLFGGMEMNIALTNVIIAVKSRETTDLVSVITKRSREGALQDIKLSFNRLLKGCESTSSITYQTSFITEFEYKQLMDVCSQPHVDNFRFILFSDILDEANLIEFIRYHQRVLIEIRGKGACSYESGVKIFRTFDDKFYVVKMY
jgi:hypothetical protein